MLAVWEFAGDKYRLGTRFYGWAANVLRETLFTILVVAAELEAHLSFRKLFMANRTAAFGLFWVQWLLRVWIVLGFCFRTQGMQIQICEVWRPLTFIQHFDGLLLAHLVWFDQVEYKLPHKFSDLFLFSKQKVGLFCVDDLEGFFERWLFF